MCGIVGSIVNGGAARITIDALKRLEYRGYDSFGVATLDDASIEVRKDVGSVTRADDSAFFDGLRDGPAAIAHTRWATHGAVEVRNAHPHLSPDNAFAVVHNGVIENFRQIKQRFSDVQWRSDTDTEVIAQLLSHYYSQSKSVEDALTATINDLEGEYALVAFSTFAPGTLYAAREKSPLAFAQFDGGVMIASDQRAIAPVSQAIMFLEDGDLVCATADGVNCYTLNSTTLAPASRSATFIEVRDGDTGLHGYPHYMLKEIHEAPGAVQTVLRGASEPYERAAEAMAGRTTSIVGAGSAFYVALMGQYLFADLAKESVAAIPSDEFTNLKTFTENDHLVAISQSGETFDTLEVMKRCREAGGVVTAVTNVFASSAYRAADCPIFQGAGAEVCVLSTKSIISQFAVLYRLVVERALRAGTLDTHRRDELMSDAKRLPEILARHLTEKNDAIKEVATRHKDIPNWFFIGRGIQYPVALESALKFKEVSYLHAEGMPAGFLKHGTISLIDKNFYTIAFLPHKASDPDLYRFTVSNMEEIHARKGNVIAVAHDESVREDLDGLTDLIVVPHVSKALDPVVQLATGQLLAYHCAVALGKNIDQPRALAKSVTVR